jgi:hypothetical protein
VVLVVPKLDNLAVGVESNLPKSRVKKVLSPSSLSVCLLNLVQKITWTVKW